MPQITAGVSGINQVAKRIFAGVSGTNREIKTGYTGVNGVNRLIFAGKVSAELTVTATNGHGGVRKGCLYTTLNSTGGGTIMSLTFTVKFDRKLTFTSDRTNAYLYRSKGSWYYLPHRLNLGSYAPASTRHSQLSSISLKLPTSKSPMVTDTASFYISNSDQASNTTSDVEAQFTRFYFYPEEYPNGLAIPMDSLVASTPSNNPTQTITLTEL